MTKTSKKQEEILRTARDLFWKHGFKRISIEEICRKASVSKMTFYRYFPGKIELARNVFDNEVDKGLKEFRSILSENIAPAAKMNKFLLLKLNGTNEISSEFLADFYNNSELGLKEHIEETTNRVWLEIVEDFKEAQKKGTFRQDFKPELLWYLSQNMMKMINDPDLIKLFNDPQQMVMELANFIIYGISGQK